MALEESLPVLRRHCPDRRERDRLELLSKRLSSSAAPLSPRAFFGLDHSGMLGAAATIVTYIIVLMQFRTS